MLKRRIEPRVEGKADLEMAQFQADLLQSVREMKAQKFARITWPLLWPAVGAAP